MELVEQAEDVDPVSFRYWNDNAAKQYLMSVFLNLDIDELGGRRR